MAYKVLVTKCKMSTRYRKNTFFILKYLLIYALLVAGIFLLPGKLPYETVKENSIIETLSAYGHFLFCFFLLYLNFTGVLRTRLAPAVFVFLLGLRELDFHARFTTMGIFKIKFFLSPEVPVGEKVAVVLLISALLAYGFSYVRKVLPTFQEAVRTGRLWAVAVLCGIACILISKLVLDGNSSLFAALLPMVENPRTLSVITEECIELFIPIFFIHALLLYGHEEKNRRADT